MIVRPRAQPMSPATTTTATRARALAEALAPETGWSPVRAADLLELVRLELGHPEILDDFQAFGTIRSMAVPLRRTLHIVSGNTPAAGIQSIARTLLLGCPEIRVKSSRRAPAVADAIQAFLGRLPDEMAAAVEWRTDLPDSWIDSADAIIAFGSDETMAALRRRVPSRARFEPHGERLSLGIVFEDPGRDAARAAARDVTAHDQLGCLSPHCLYVGGSDPTSAARRFAALLAEALAEEERRRPRPPIPPDAAAEIANLRSSYAFRAASDPRVALHQSTGSTAWTVVFEDATQFAVSPLHRFVFVKPWPADPGPSLRLVRRHLGTIAVWPFRDDLARQALASGATRACPMGQAQEPTVFWHQDAGPALPRLVRWLDLG